LFKNYDRHIAILNGCNMTLQIDSNPEVTLTQQSPPLKFSGDVNTFATIKNPNLGLTDFNVIVKRGLAHHELTRIISNSNEKVKSDIWYMKNEKLRFLVFYTNQGELTISSKEECFTLKEGDTCVIDTPLENWNVVTSDQDNDYFIFKLFKY
jgi:environmental stress-induced protein Ves